jgi:hypothetical protein
MFGLLGFGSFPLGRIGQDKLGCPPGRDVSRTDEGPPGAETSGPACTLYRPSPPSLPLPLSDGEMGYQCRLGDLGRLGRMAVPWERVRMNRRVGIVADRGTLSG